MVNYYLKERNVDQALAICKSAITDVFVHTKRAEWIKDSWVRNFLTNLLLKRWCQLSPCQCVILFVCVLKISKHICTSKNRQRAFKIKTNVELQIKKLSM